MDKSWMHKSRSSPEYLNGVIEFLNFAFDHATNDDKIPCPCVKCCNKYYKNREDVHGDLLWNGIMQRYINWTSHGEYIYGGEYISDESEEGDDVIRLSISISSQCSSVHPPPQPIEGPSEIQSRPTPTEVGRIGSSSNSNIGKKRTRGSNRGIKLFDRQPDDKLIVQFNAEGQPIGENARPFATLCGIIVRTPGYAPLQVTKWADVPKHAKEKMWKHIQDYAVVDDERKKWVLQSLGKKYRDYKKDIKDKYYSSWNTDEERLQHRPPSVSSEDWAWLVQYWGNPKVQVVVSKNKANRSRQTLKHTGGTKSSARHIDEETRSRTDGSMPSRADLFIHTHSRKDGTPIDEKSTEIISKFEEVSATQEGGSSSSIGDEIYTHVMGLERHGCVRGYGLGPMPTSVFGSTSRQSQAAFDEVVGELSSLQQKLQQIVELKKNLEEGKRQMEEWKKAQEEQKRQMEEWKKKAQEEQKRQMEEWKKAQEEEKCVRLEEMKLMHAIIAEMRQQLSAKRQDPSKGGADG